MGRRVHEVNASAAVAVVHLGREPRLHLRESGSAGLVVRSADPGTRSSRREPAARRRFVRCLLVAGVLLVCAAAAAGWLAYRAAAAHDAVAALRRDGTQLQNELARYDLVAAGPTLTNVRQDAAKAHALTSDPIWRAASMLPYAGRRLRAAEVSTSTMAQITTASRPLELALPQLDPSRMVASAAVKPSLPDDAVPDDALAGRAAATAAKRAATDRAATDQVAPSAGSADGSATTADRSSAGPAPSGAAVPSSGFDTDALNTLAQSLPDVSAAISAGALRMGEIDVGKLPEHDAAGVRQLQSALSAARGPIADAVPVFSLLPSMLGADRAKTWMILLQQDAQARGTGGLIGAYAVMKTDAGQVQLVTAHSRGVVDKGPVVPSTALPAGLRDLWGSDLSEWSGLNASPNFPWTGHLVAAGWKARGLPALDYVAAVDPYTIAAMLSATGPVTVRGTRVTDKTAVRFLSRDVYATWKQPQQADTVVTELVRDVFVRFAGGQLDVPRLIKALREPAEQRRLLVWAADPQQQSQLSGYDVAGALPTEPGPFAMAVVNNGGGNMLDAYLKVHTDYRPGGCVQGNRLGWISVTLDNTAPRRGLPGYVTSRSDLALLHQPRKHVTGSNRLVLDIYGPVSGQAALTTLDGRAVAPIRGFDSNHSVWRVYVPIGPGQKRTVRVIVLAPAVDGDTTSTPLVLRQPMVNPVTTSSQPATACSATGPTPAQG